MCRQRRDGAQGAPIDAKIRPPIEARGASEPKTTQPIDGPRLVVDSRTDSLDRATTQPDTISTRTAFRSGRAKPAADEIERQSDAVDGDGSMRKLAGQSPNAWPCSVAQFLDVELVQGRLNDSELPAVNIGEGIDRWLGAADGIDTSG